MHKGELGEWSLEILAVNCFFLTHDFISPRKRAKHCLASKYMIESDKQKNVFTNVLQTEVPLRQKEFMQSKRNAHGKFQIDFSFLVNLMVPAWYCIRAAEHSNHFFILYV